MLTLPRLGGALAGTKAAVDDKYAGFMDDVETVVACEWLGGVE